MLHKKVLVKLVVKNTNLTTLPSLILIDNRALPPSALFYSQIAFILARFGLRNGRPSPSEQVDESLSGPFPGLGPVIVVVVVNRRHFGLSVDVLGSGRDENGRVAAGDRRELGHVDLGQTHHFLFVFLLVLLGLFSQLLQLQSLPLPQSSPERIGPPQPQIGHDRRFGQVGLNGRRRRNVRMNAA